MRSAKTPLRGKVLSIKVIIIMEKAEETMASGDEYVGFILLLTLLS